MATAATELLVVDNTEGDQDAERIAEEFRAKYIVESNIGISRARNRGFSESTSEVVFFIDDDATPDEAWLARMAEPFADPRVALVTGRISTVTHIMTPPGDSTWRI